MESLLNTALLGTEKGTLEDHHNDPELMECLVQIRATTTDREDAFMQSAALLYNYRQCGFQPLQKPEIDIQKAEPEEDPYVSSSAAILLNSIIETESHSLVRFWLERCNNSRQIVEPEFIPALLDFGINQPGLRTLIQTCCGKRGKWLQPFNTNWNWQSEDKTGVWETGTINERKSFLKIKRVGDPATARILLENVWPQENAATRVDLLQQLQTNAGSGDLPFLESLLTDKSPKVRDAALAILKIIPESSVLKQYKSVLRQSFEIVRSKGLFGIGAGDEFKIELKGANEALFQTGIQQVSSQPNVSDEAFILSQLVAAVPPSFWEQEFNPDIPTIIQLFARNQTFPGLLSNLGSAAAKFSDLRWIQEIIPVDKENLYEGALTLLPQDEAEKYALRFFNHEQHIAGIIFHAQSFQNEWNLSFAKAVITYTAKDTYSRKYYNRIAALLPVSLADHLVHCTPMDENQRLRWMTVQEHLQRLLALKKQTLTLIKY